MVIRDEWGMRVRICSVVWLSCDVSGLDRAAAGVLVSVVATKGVMITSYTFSDGGMVNSAPDWHSSARYARSRMARTASPRFVALFPCQTEILENHRSP